MLPIIDILGSRPRENRQRDRPGKRLSVLEAQPDLVLSSLNLHYDFAKITYSLPLTSINAASTVDVARAGISYKF